MDELKKIYRIFQIISRLRTPIGTTKRSLAEAFDVNIRTIDRYFKLLRDLGFTLEKNKSRFRIPEISNKNMNTEDLIVFNLEEADIIKQALLNHKIKDPLQKSLLTKLYALTDLEELSETIYNQNVSKNINNLRHSIKYRKQAILVDYQSVNSQTTCNRIIEPLKFYNYFTYLHAFEIESKQVKQYKTERITEVLVRDEDWQFEEHHDYASIDVFGMTGKDPVDVKLYLSPRASKLLKEEFPDATNFIKTRKGITYFEGIVYDFAGIARFIMGLIDETDVIHPPELKKYVHSKMKRFLSLYNS